MYIYTYIYTSRYIYIYISISTYLYLWFTGPMKTVPGPDSNTSGTSLPSIVSDTCQGQGQGQGRHYIYISI